MQGTGIAFHRDTHARHSGQTPYAAAGSTASSRVLPVASAFLLQANGDNASDSSGPSREREEADGEDEEIDGHDRRPRNRDCDTTVKGPRSDSLRRGSITDGWSSSPAHGTRPKKGILGALFLLSSTHQRLCSPAVPGPEVELGGWSLIKTGNWGSKRAVRRRLGTLYRFADYMCSFDL